MKTETTKTPTVSENFTLIEAMPKRRGRPPGSKSKPKAKAKPVVKAKAKPVVRSGIPRTARAYMYRYADRRFDTEAAAVVELVRLFDEALSRPFEKSAPKNEIKLGGFRQFLVNFCAGQPVKVLPRK